MHKFICLLILITTLHAAHAQPFHITLKHITEENGLSDNHVTCVLKDDQNIVWIGTADGLNMLDGSAITVYKNEPGNTKSISANNINCLLQADKENLFIGTALGISVFNKHTRSFSQIGIPQSKYGASNIVTALAADAKQHIWCCTDGGLYRYNSSLKKMEPVINTAAGAEEAAANKPIKIYAGRNQKLWLCTYDGLWCYDINKAMFTRINDKGNDKAYEPLTLSAFEDADRNIWFGNWSTGLKKYDPKSGEVSDFLMLPNAPTNVLAVSEITLPNGKKMICTGNELNCLDPGKRQFFNFLHSFGSTVEPAVLNFYTDAAGFMWLGSNNGVYIYAPQCQEFQHTIFNESITGQNVNFLELGDKILIGGEHENFLKSYTLDLQQSTDLFPNYQSREATLGLVKEDENNILISSTGGIIKYNLSTKKRTVFTHIAADSSTLPRNFIQNIFIDSKKQCWIFPWRMGIYKMNTATGKTVLQCKGLTKRSDAIKGLVITDAAEDAQGNIWMADLDEGIIEYDAKENKFLKPFIKQIGEGAHSAKIIYRNGYCYSFANNTLLKWNTIDKALQMISLPNQIEVVDFILDKNNYWWIATKKGLLVYNEKSNSFKNLTTADGLYTNIMDGVFYAKQNGDILFCSNKYISTFKPDALINTFNSAVNLLLTGVEVNGKYIDYDSSNSIKLGYEENNLLFKWAVTDYINPLNNQYYCQLQGIDTGFKYIGSKGEVQYASLSPGSYTLLLTGSTAKGDFAKAPIRIQFTITPPFWKTIWFLLICAAVVSAFLYLVISKRIKNIRNKALLQQQMSELELKALRAQMNPHFIFNSLSSIQESIVNNKTEAASKYLSKFSKLIRMLLENSGKKFITLKEELEYLQLYLELESFRFDDLHFEIFCDLEETALIKIPPMIVQPYIENALKHGLAHKAGSKQLTVKFYTDAEENLFAEVIDNGIGRQQSAIINQSRLASHQSMGMQITEQRLSLLQTNLPQQITISDLEDKDENPAGTAVKNIITNRIMITAIIIDDEKKCISLLQKTIEKQFSDISIVATAANADDGIKLIQQHEPDLIFLDIEMPNKNGFDMLAAFDEINFDVIFTTAYNQYAIKAIKFSALDYLLKPIDADDLKLAISRFKQKQRSSQKSQINLLFDNLKNLNHAYSKISVSTNEGVIFLNTADIIYCEATGNYTQFYLRNNEKLLSSRTLKDFEELLAGNNFFRVHHSYLINLNEIKRYIKGDGGSVIMSNTDEVLVSRRKKDEFMKKLNL